MPALAASIALLSALVVPAAVARVEAAATVLARSVASVAGAGDGAGARAVAYRPPVTAAVSDPFRPPPTPYGPGNRGIEYATAPGARVRAAAPGVVGFAGQVAGRRYVSVEHADGVRTTYGPLGRVAVRRGATVGAGDLVGTAAGRLLWTARIGGAYVDPAALLAASGNVRFRLVADDASPPGGRWDPSSGGS